MRFSVLFAFLSISSPHNRRRFERLFFIPLFPLSSAISAPSCKRPSAEVWPGVTGSARAVWVGRQGRRHQTPGYTQGISASISFLYHATIFFIYSKFQIYWISADGEIYPIYPKCDIYEGTCIVLTEYFIYPIIRSDRVRYIRVLLYHITDSGNFYNPVFAFSTSAAIPQHYW